MAALFFFLLNNNSPTQQNIQQLNWFNLFNREITLLFLFLVKRTGFSRNLRDFKHSKFTRWNHYNHELFRQNRTILYNKNYFFFYFVFFSSLFRFVNSTKFKMQTYFRIVSSAHVHFFLFGIYLFIRFWNISFALVPSRETIKQIIDGFVPTSIIRASIRKNSLLYRWYLEKKKNCIWWLILCCRSTAIAQQNICANSVASTV